MAPEDLSSIPAGYFSTFSISDPGCSTLGISAKIQLKRNRRVFVCLPCHRRKLRCDKQQPCGRCMSTGYADRCVYQPIPPSTPSASGLDKKSIRKRVVSKKKSKIPTTDATRESTPWARSPSATDTTYSQSLETEMTTTPTTNPVLYAADDDSCGCQKADKLGLETSTRRTAWNGTSHWTTVACEFEDAIPYLFGTDLEWQPRYRQIKSLKCLYPSLSDNVNFPFSCTSLNQLSKTQVLNALPPPPVMDSLVDIYMDTFEATHCLFHRGQLRKEMDDFRGAPHDVSDDWLAQLCMILALAVEAAPDSLFHGTGHSAAEWTAIFVDAGQACFGRSPYMAKAKLTTVRTLCMMVLAKFMEIKASGGSTSTSSSGSNSGYAPLISLMAFVSRTAMSLQLHRPAHLAPNFASLKNEPLEMEADLRQRIWTTVQLLELDTAMRSGTTVVDAGYDAEPHRPTCRGFCPDQKPNWENRSRFSTRTFSGESGEAAGDAEGGARLDDYTDAQYRNELSGFLPLLIKVINAVNSPSPPNMSHDKVCNWDAQIRHRLRGAEKALLQSYQHNCVQAGLPNGAMCSASPSERAATQHQFLEVLANRTLIALHHKSFCHSLPGGTGEGSQDGTGSTTPPGKTSPHMVIVESSLALLDIQRAWSPSSSSEFAGRCPSASTSMEATAMTESTATYSISSPDTIAVTMNDTQLRPPITFGLPSPTIYDGHGETVDMTTAAAMPSTRCHGWLLDLCHDDFGTALMYMVLELRAALQTGSAIHESQEAAAVVAVRHGYQTMRDRSYRSVAHFTEFLGIAILFACFRGLQSGNMLPHVLDAANDVEQVVVAGRRYMLWADNNTFTPEEDLMGLDASILEYSGL